MQLFQVSVEKQLNRLNAEAISSNKGRDPNSHLIQGNSLCVWYWWEPCGSAPQPLFALPCLTHSYS